MKIIQMKLEINKSKKNNWNQTKNIPKNSFTKMYFFIDKKTQINELIEPLIHT